MAVPSPGSLLTNLLDRVRTSLWFVPGALLFLAAALAWGAIEIDQRTDSAGFEILPGLGVSTPGSARLLMSTLAGSLITLTGVVFSITIVAFTLASQQFGPRLLRGFMRDRATQFVLGIFVATSLYCLLVLYSVRSEEHGEFVPQLAVLIALVLVILAIGALVFFLHHVSTSIHASHVVSNVARELEDQVRQLFPEDLGDEAEIGEDEVLAPLRFRFERDEVATVTATRSGYVRLVDGDRLMDLVVERDALVEVVATPGAFVLVGQALIRIAGLRECDDELADDLRGCVVLGSRRTPIQDLLFSIDQLVEVGLRALSPGVNDPQTAMDCVHRLGQGLARMVGRALPSPVRSDDGGAPRVIARPVTFRHAVEAAFLRLHRAADRSPEVRETIQSTLAQIAELTKNADRRAVLEDVAKALRHDDARG